MTVGAGSSDAPSNANTQPVKPGGEAQATAEAKNEQAKKERDAKSDAKLREEYLQMLASGGDIYRETKTSTCPTSSESCVLTNVSIDSGSQAPIDLDGFKAKIASANDFIGQANGGKGDQNALQNWLFQSKDGTTSADFKGGALDVHTKAADGADVSANIGRDVADIKAGDATIKHFRNDGANIYESASYEAIDKGDVRIIKDKASGYTVQYDVKTHEGKIFRKDGELAMSFSSMKDLQTEVTHRLSDQKYMTQLIGKQKLEAEARAYLKALKPGDPHAPKERGFVDGQGDFIVVTRDGLMYQTDKANHSVYIEQNGQRVRVTNGIAYTDSTVNGVTTSTQIHDFKKMGPLSVHNGAVFMGAKELVSSAGQVNTAEGTKIDAAAGKLTTQGDTGLVTVQSGNGVSTVINPHVATLNLTDNGKFTNSLKETQGAFSSFDPKTGLEGHAANGASYNFGKNNDEIQVREPNGQVTDIRDNGSVRSADRNGAELARIDQNGDITLGGHFKIGHNGQVTDDGQAVGEVQGDVRANAIAEFDLALGDIDAAMGNPSGDLGGLESKLNNDVGNMSQLAAYATSLGPRFAWAAEILIAKSQQAQAASDRVKQLIAEKGNTIALNGSTGGTTEQAGFTPTTTRSGSQGLEPDGLAAASLTQTDLLSGGALLDQATVVPTSFTAQDTDTNPPQDTPVVTTTPDKVTPANTDEVPAITTPADPVLAVVGNNDEVSLSPGTDPEGTTLLASALPFSAPNENLLQSGFLPTLDGGNRSVTARNRIERTDGMIASSGAPETTLGNPLAANPYSQEDLTAAIGAVAPLFKADQLARNRQPHQLPLPKLGFQPIDGDPDEQVGFGTPGADPLQSTAPLRRHDQLPGQLASTERAPRRVEKRDGLGMTSNRNNFFESSNSTLSFPPIES